MAVAKLVEQIESFLQEELYESAEILASFLLSRTQLQKLTATNTAESYYQYSRYHWLYARALFGRTNYQRSIYQYKNALQYLKLAQTVPAEPLDICDDTLTQPRLMYQMAQAYLKINDTKAAIATLESINPKETTLAMHLLLAKLYHQTDFRKQAAEQYQHVLKINPYALEATAALARLQAQAEKELRRDNRRSTVKIGELYGSTYVQTDVAIDPQDRPWLQLYAQAHMHLNNYELQKSMDCFANLINQFPKNLYCLMKVGEIQAEMGKYSNAVATYTRVRQIDPRLINNMDCYATSLMKLKSIQDLCTWIHQANLWYPNRAETWLCASIYDYAKKEDTRALQFCDRAISCSPQYARAYTHRGCILLRLKRSEQALTAFMTSNKHRRTMANYEGIMRAYQDIGLAKKYNEALSNARDAVKYMPSEALAHNLLGQVYSYRPDFIDRAVKSYEKALDLSVASFEAHKGLAEIEIEQKKYLAAIERLTKLAQSNPTDDVFVMLGLAFMENQQYAESLGHFHMAMSINEDNEEAQQFIARLEALMRGEDPSHSDDLENSLEENYAVDFTPERR